MLYTRTFYGLTYLFHRLPMPRIFKPAVGAFLTGAVGLGLYYAVRPRTKQVLSVLSFGYGILQDGLDATTKLATLAAAAAAGGGAGQDPDDGPDDRQRRLRRRVRPVDGDRRLRRRGAGHRCCTALCRSWCRTRRAS